MSTHGKWSQPGVPHLGWTCQEVEDSGPGSDFICEMCESQEIRFIHEMIHPAYPETLRCGCVCAGNMEGDRAAARGREDRARLTAARRDHWPRRAGWRVSAKGNPYLRFEDLVIQVFPLFGRQDQFGFLIRHRGTDRELVRSRKPLATEYAARQRTFDAARWLRDQRLKPPWDVGARPKPP